MEYTMMGSFACLLMGFLIQDHNENEVKLRKYLKHGNFKSLVVTLEKYHNFMNLTAGVSIFLNNIYFTKNE